MRIQTSLLCGAAVLSAISAQSPIPATTPRAHWVLTPGVTGTPSQRRENPGVASNDKMYVFGGRDANAGTSLHNALYEFDGTTWTLKTADNAPGSPSPRDRAAIAWDFANNRLLVFGGDTGVSAPALAGDLWQWDPLTNVWTDITPGFGPAPRRFSSMTFDPASNGIVLFGGETSTSPVQDVDDTWLLIAGNVWIPQAPTNVPPARRQHSLVTRSNYGDVFLCAGGDFTTSPTVVRPDAWRWDGGNWIQIPTLAFPHSINANQAVYDPLRRRVVLQGGQGIGATDPTNYPGWGGSPSTWCSEFDCVTNDWILYGQPAFGTADPVIGRISRYFAAFVPALGKIYKVSGQNPSGTGTVTGTCEYQATPVAAATTLGAGCNGTIGGPVTLTADNLPWLGRTFNATTTGLAPASLSLMLLGFGQQSLPVAGLHPAGLPGCNLLVTLDSSAFMVNAGGTASFSITMPANNNFVGATLNLQTLQVELGPTLQISGISTSNGLGLLFGAL